ncbi:accessory gene regulator B family protein [Paenibacillus puerhi]|uniref:accessory gene regulator B family protein n=1 Tax=Paenibacillus puerhi TaxID=2692622 RepID=UPI00135751CC
MNPNLIDRTARYLAISIRNNYPAAHSESVLTYSLITLINTLSAIIISLIVSVFTNHIFETTITIIAFLAIRYVSGGMHLSSSVHCSIFSSIVILISSHIFFQYQGWGQILNFISLIILSITAPNGIKGVSRISERYYPILKLISCIIVLLNFWIQSPSLSMIYFIQAVLTTKVAYSIKDYFEGGHHT